MSVDYRIIAVRERSKIVDSIIESIRPQEAIVFFDDEHKGCIWNALRAWKSCEQSEGTHICVLQDDIELADNFCIVADMISKLFPEAIVAFYNQDLNAKDFDGSTYGILPTCSVSAPAIMMPKDVAIQFVRFFNSHLDLSYNYDDGAIRMFAILSNVQVLTMCPSIVRCIDCVKSTFGNSHSKKNTSVWCGGHADINLFKNLSVKTLRPVSIKTHLPSGHPLRVAVEKAVALKKKVYT